MKPRVHCRHGTPDADLRRRDRSGNGTRYPVRDALRSALLIVWAGTAGGCSLSFPVSGLDPDRVPTGSIDRTVAVLSPSLDREDLRRARAAMAVALDPQGNGARAGWQNSQTGAHGGFAAAAPPFADHDRVCRRFTGEVTAAGRVERRIVGSACRDGDGMWHVSASPDERA